MKHKSHTGTATATVIFVLSGILVSVLGVRQVSRMSSVDTWVASADLSPGQTITRAMLRPDRAREVSGIITDPRHLIGKTLMAAKAEGEAFVSTELASPPQSRLSQVIPEGKVLYTLIPRKDTIPISQLQPGDRFDVLARDRLGEVRTIARSVQLIGTLNSKNGSQNEPSGRGLLASLATLPDQGSKNPNTGTPLVVAVSPHEVYPLAMIGAEDTEVTLVLHGATEVEKGELLNVTPDPNRRRIEVVNGLTREHVLVRL